jgi:hypothetical protein
MANIYATVKYATRKGCVVAVFLLGCLCVRGAVVRTLDGKSYEGEVFLEPGGSVSVVLPDSVKKNIPLRQVQLATFTSPQLSLGQFSPIAEGWTNIDIGEVSIPGVAAQSNRLFAIQVASADIGGQADALHFVYFRAKEDVDVVARVLSLAGADRLARTGVMFRDSLRPDSKFAFAALNSAGQLSLQQRADTGKAASTSSTTNIALPCWLKIARREKSFSVYRSSDGKAWEQFGGGILNLKDAGFYAGLALTSHSAFSFGTAMIGEVSRVVGGVRGEYFADADFSKLATNRIDSQINFHWPHAPPVEGIAAANFSVRWTGELEPKYSEAYTFYYDAEDARLWVNDQELPQLRLLRETRDPQPAPLPLLLKAGNRYPFRFEYRHKTGRLPVRIGWSSQTQGREILPARRLFCSLEAQAQSGQRLTSHPEWVMGRGIMLRDGSFIAGTVRSLSEAGAKFSYRTAQEYTVPLHQVARAVFRVSPRNAILSKENLPPGALLGSGDFVEGQVQLGSGRSAKVSSVLLGLRSYSLESSDLAALVLNDPGPISSPYRLRLSDNSVIVAKSITVEQQDVAIVEPVLGTLRIPRETVTELRANR